MRVEKIGGIVRYDWLREDNHAKSAIVAHDNLLNFQTKHHTGQWERFQVSQNNGRVTDSIIIDQLKLNMRYIGSETRGNGVFSTNDKLMA